MSNDDPVIFAASGFTAKPTGKSAPQPVAVPSFRSLDYGANSGQIAVAVKSVVGGKSYFIRYAVMNGTTPGPWTTVPAASIQKAITISGLTPQTVYGFQVQALGVAVIHPVRNLARGAVAACTKTVDIFGSIPTAR